MFGNYADVYILKNGVDDIISFSYTYLTFFFFIETFYVIFFSFPHLLFCTSALREKKILSLFTEKIYSIGFKSFNGPLWNKPFYVILVKVNNNKIKDQNWFKENNFSFTE